MILLHETWYSAPHFKEGVLMDKVPTYLEPCGGVRLKRVQLSVITAENWKDWHGFLFGALKIACKP